MTCCFKDEKPQGQPTIIQQTKDYLPYILLGLALLSDR